MSTSDHGRGRDTRVGAGGRPGASCLAWPVAESRYAGTIRLALRVAGALTAAALAVAVLVHLSFFALARRWLAYPFAGLPAEPGVATGIFLHNLRALGAIAGLLLVAQSVNSATRDPGRMSQALLLLGEVVLAGAVAANVIVVGASLGAYGTRMADALLPHGPVELAAYAMALALYLEGRKRPLPPAHIASIATLSVITLAFAAVLETFATL